MKYSVLGIGFEKQQKRVRVQQLANNEGSAAALLIQHVDISIRSKEKTTQRQKAE